MPLILFSGEMAVNASGRSAIYKAHDDAFAAGQPADLEMRTSQWHEGKHEVFISSTK